MNSAYSVKASNKDNGLTFPCVASDEWAPVATEQANKCAALFEALLLAYGSEIGATRERKKPNNVWSIPVNPRIKTIKGDYSELPSWAKKLADKFVEQKNTDAVVVFEEGDHYVFRVFANNFSADLLGEYCDLYVDLTNNCDDCCCDFRVITSCDIREDGFPKDAVIVRM